MKPSQVLRIFLHFRCIFKWSKVSFNIFTNVHHSIWPKSTMICSHEDDCFHDESSVMGTSLSLYAPLFNNIFAFSTAFMSINTFYMFQNNSFQVIEYLINLVWQLIQYDWLGLLWISHETMRQLIEGSLRSQMGKTTSCSPPIIHEEAMWELMIEFLKGIKCNKMITFNQIHHTSSLGRIGREWHLLGI